MELKFHTIKEIWIVCHTSTTYLVLVCGSTVVLVNENLQELSVPKLTGKQDCRGAKLQNVCILYGKMLVLYSSGKRSPQTDRMYVCCTSIIILARIEEMPMLWWHI